MTQPYKCPICGGNGIVSSGFYNQTSGNLASGNVTEQCRACYGTGLIWEPIVHKEHESSTTTTVTIKGTAGTTLTFCTCDCHVDCLVVCAHCGKPKNKWSGVVLT